METSKKQTQNFFFDFASRKSSHASIITKKKDSDMLPSTKMPKQRLSEIFGSA